MTYPDVRDGRYNLTDTVQLVQSAAIMIEVSEKVSKSVRRAMQRHE